jgi:hypothetical protein
MIYDQTLWIHYLHVSAQSYFEKLNSGRYIHGFLLPLFGEIEDDLVVFVRKKRKGLLMLELCIALFNLKKAVVLPDGSCRSNIALNTKGAASAKAKSLFLGAPPQQRTIVSPKVLVRFVSVEESTLFVEYENIVTRDK